MQGLDEARNKLALANRTLAHEGVTVLSDTPIASAIAGCVIPLSRNNTIWMRWRSAAGIFQ
jgi:hypothetical protein